MNNKIEEVKCDFEIVEMDDLEGFTLNKKEQGVKITMYNKDLIERIIDNNFNKKYRSLLYLVMELDSDDTTESDTELARLKIDDLRRMLITKYFKYISRDLLEKYLNMLILLEEKIPIVSKNRGR